MALLSRDLITQQRWLRVMVKSILKLKRLWGHSTGKTCAIAIAVLPPLEQGGSF